jgi:hypothetical protein
MINLDVHKLLSKNPDFESARVRVFKVFLEIDISSPKLQTSNEANDAVAANNFHCQQ